MATLTPTRNGVPLEGDDAPDRLRSQVDDRLPPEPLAVGMPEADPEKTGGLSDEEAIRLAREAYDSATDYVDENYRKKWETSLRYFDSRHASDSKYYKDAYKHRHKHFRPKSRSIARRIEALVANAYFSNEQRINVEPQNPSDPMGAATAQMTQSLIDYRLKKSIPWFLTVVGAMQDAVKTGVCVSYNYWCYKSKPAVRQVAQPVMNPFTGQPMVDPMTGQPMTQTVEVPHEEVIEDRPKIELFPIEYLRISPNAKWDDPINTSPYIGRMVPMNVADIRAKMEKEDRSGRKWRDFSDSEIRAKGQLPDRDSTAQTRLAGRTDPKEDHTEVKDYEIAWAIEWFIQRGTDTYVYWTLGSDTLLSDVMELDDVYLHGKVPITMGYCVLETHKPMPDGIIGIGAPTQRIINDNVNMRNDNVALVLSKQWAIRAGQQVDTSNLMYGVPGGVTAFQNPQTDVVPLEWNDVTSSAYQEQDRHNVDYDELVGNFSASSVMTGKNMSETVGGMEILGSGAATLSEYTVLLFTETWVIPTLSQLGMLEQFYETDERVFALCGEAAQNAYRATSGEQGAPPVDAVIENLISDDALVTITVGMNATDPNRKLQRFLFACNQVAQFSANMPPAANTAEMAKEVFRILGLGDGSRFWDANEAAKQMLNQAKDTAQNMLKEADTMARNIMDQADQRRRNAEQAEEAAMEEQQQLNAERTALIERGVAAAMKEIKVANEQEVLNLQKRIAVLEVQKAAQPPKGPPAK